MKYFLSLVICAVYFVLLVIIFALLGAQKYGAIFATIYVVSVIFIWRKIVHAKFWVRNGPTTVAQASIGRNDCHTSPFRDPSFRIADRESEHSMDEDEKLFYTKAAREAAERKYEPALFAKAYSDSEGDENKTIALYIRYRVVELREQHEHALAQAAERKKQEQELVDARLKRENELQEELRLKEMQEKCEMSADGRTVCPNCGYAGRMRHKIWDISDETVVCPLCANNFKWHYVSSDKVRYSTDEETKEILAERKRKNKEREKRERDLRRRLELERSEPVEPINPDNGTVSGSMKRAEYYTWLGIVLLVVMAWIYFLGKVGCRCSF